MSHRRFSTLSLSVALVFSVSAFLQTTARAETTPTATDQPQAATGVASSDLLAMPLTASAVRSVAAVRLKSGDLTGALTLLRKGLELDPHDPDTYATLAEAQAAAGQNDDAMRSWRLAVGEDPGQTWSSSRMLEGDLNLRFTLFLLGREKYAEAAKRYGDGLGTLTAADSALLPEKFSSRDLKRNADTRSRFVAAVNTALGMSYADSRRNEDASRAFRAALEAIPEDPIAEFRLGRALLAAGHKDEALKAWSRVAQSSERLDLRVSAEQELAKAQ